MRILFIGNSYTYYNDMRSMMEKLLLENGTEAVVDSVTGPGYQLHQYLDVNDEYAKILNELIEVNHYDICILQENRVIPFMRNNLFMSAVQDLKTKLDEKVERFLLYETWGREDGHPFLLENNLTHEEMTTKLVEAYKKAGASIGADVSNVGQLFHKIYRNHPEIDLYNEDGTHPSYIGSCVGVLSHYKTIFGKLPERISSLGLNELDKKVILSYFI